VERVDHAPAEEFGRDGLCGLVPLAGLAEEQLEARAAGRKSDAGVIERSN
jgi:hypothetical protein